MSIASSSSADAASLQRSRLTERLLIPAGFITTAGNAFQITAAAILVFRAGQTSLAVGWLFIAVSIPQVAFSLLFGRLVDKFDRRTLCVTADVISAVTAIALPVWLWLGGPTTLGSYLANFLLACTAALFMPASNALVKERIRDGRLGKYNSHYEMATNAGMLLSSSAAGFLVVAFGPEPLFIFNSGTFLVSALLTYLVGRKPAQAPPASEAVEVQVTDAASARPAARPPIKRLALLFTIGNANLMVSNVLLTVVILRTFHQSAWMIGVVDALAGSGFIVGAGLYSRVASRIKPLNLAVLGTVGCMTMVIFEPLSDVALMSVIPVAAFCFAQGRIASRTLLMRASPEDRVGRIFGGAQAFGLALGIAATIGLSALADAVSVPWAFWGLVVLVDAVAIGAFLSLRGRLPAAAEAAAEQPAAEQPAEVLDPATAITA